MPDIHLATVDDWDRCRAVRLAALAEAPDAFGSQLADEVDQPPSFWRGRLQRGTWTFLAVVAGRDVGIAVLADVWDGGSDLAVYSVWVDPAARGAGVGRALVVACIDAARAHGAPRLRLEVGDHNLAAIALYAAMGFVPTGRTSCLPAPRAHLTEHERVLEL